ncbi:hypothetical protein I204_08102 [Kwoniella mangroviensis CBS 8886]|uniref:uncharacterized protein n=1 Tax=Kwoniella mangroviensis CBS 8507 TaxID=1296122 RepID=UPI00080CD668|nr:uncharacterized protein I203_04538 [Kwoniella mangroviensis CBS 8507]OCF66212.1 hypothetical protein I203_04538 [Kwoniella mangroviensis CBS 8507]OCF71149.1 hypothetical protein I204_08102 [Kwoniella mangroviensis CBS 8886]
MSSLVHGPPEWQNTIKERLMAKQVENELYKDIVDQYRRLAKTARELKVRNRALAKSGGGPSSAEGSSALLSHLDAQLTSLRSELSTLYRTQAASQNKQLSMADALRDRDEEVKGLRDELRELRDQRDNAYRKDRDWEERWRVRNKDMETLHDELLSLNLELSSLAQQNKLLKVDNANLLQRWIDKMNLTAEEMNIEFEKEQNQNQNQNKAIKEDDDDGDDGEGEVPISISVSSSMDNLKEDNTLIGNEKDKGKTKSKSPTKVNPSSSQTLKTPALNKPNSTTSIRTKLAGSTPTPSTSTGRTRNISSASAINIKEKEKKDFQ